jgi:hypothetical protein
VQTCFGSQKCDENGFSKDLCVNDSLNLLLHVDRLYKLQLQVQVVLYKKDIEIVLILIPNRSLSVTFTLLLKEEWTIHPTSFLLTQARVLPSRIGIKVTKAWVKKESVDVL